MQAMELHAGTAGAATLDWQLFGWNPTPGIVSVWAGRDGRALTWQRLDDRVRCTPARFRPWLLASHLDDLKHLGTAFVPDLEPDVATAQLASEAIAPRASDTPAAQIRFRELDGPPESYRFLVSAGSWATLEQAILAGARSRGLVVKRLAELGDDYYRVGLVEQYLMQSGQTCFRGMTFDDLHRMQIDLETTGLDPQHERIFMVALRDSRGLERVIEAPQPADEPDLIRALVALVRERDPDVIENHNLFGFDLPFLEQRAARHRIALDLGRAPGPLRLERSQDRGNGWGSRRERFSLAGRELLDTLDAVRRHDFVTRDLPSHRLKDIARVYGLADPDRVYLEGTAIYATYQHEPERVTRYALQDVAEVDALSRRLHVAPFALAQMAPRRYDRLATAGPAMGILEPMLVRTYLRAGAAPPCQAPAAALEPHSGGALHLFASGLAGRVVKADIASLYPSLMRTFRIGPQPDRIGALLYLVERLTDLRLAHKAAMREAPAGSAAAGHHDALQAAMKLLINSAYGYMGAGDMAMFADRAAADEVTRRGRELLGQVVEALRGRGMGLIEADTDGVYFAVPQGWDEQRERDLVAAVAATLPPGIRLEYEGRYQAMFSHTVKNYALLRDDGRLIVRGAALRSSRSEPFGENFLRTALHCLLHDDIAGAVEAFRTTVAALRARALPTREIATRVRLARTPQAYRKSRERQREGQYEALLAAGRNDWSVGERVRVYKARGAWAWLPDDTPTDPRDYDVEHYLHVLLQTYAGRLRSAFHPEDFAQLFRPDGQLGLFDVPVGEIQAIWLRLPPSGDG